MARKTVKDWTDYLTGVAARLDELRQDLHPRTKATKKAIRTTVEASNVIDRLTHCLLDSAALPASPAATESENDLPKTVH